MTLAVDVNECALVQRDTSADLQVKLPDAGGVIFGMCVEGGLADEIKGIIRAGSDILVPCELAGDVTLTVEPRVKVDITGKVLPCTSGKYVIGRALETGVTGQFVLVQLYEEAAQATM